MHTLFKRSGFLIILALAALACNLGKPQKAEPTVAVSTEAAGSLVETWSQALETARETGTLSVTMTEEQLTSFLAISIAEEEGLPFSNPQVLLRSGEMEIKGVYKTDFVDANVSIVLNVTVGSSGLPLIEVKSGSVGPLPVPADLLSSVADAINEALTGQIPEDAAGFSLDSITISDGSLSLTGSLD